MRVFDSSRNIAIVAHDAGAANHISAWLESGLLEQERAKVCFEGPAKKNLINSGVKIETLSLENALRGVNTLISGTGWGASLEHNARKLAKINNIHSIAVLDHWVNYKERFIWNGQEVLPDTLWVSDEIAYDLALNTFPKLNVELQPNHYLDSQLRMIKSFSKPTKQSKKALFLMEPIRDSDIKGYTEFEAFGFWVANLDIIGLDQSVEIVIRPHPSDPDDKYDSLNSEYSDLNITIEEKVTLAEHIGWADIVVGCQTYAMVVALAAKKKVVSALPPQAPKCCLPHNEIINLCELV